MYSNMSGILQQICQLGSFGYISTAVATNWDIWFLTHGRFVIVSENHKLNKNFITEINIKFVGWFIVSVVLYKKGSIFVFFKDFKIGEA